MELAIFRQKHYKSYGKKFCNKHSCSLRTGITVKFAFGRTFSIGHIDQVASIKKLTGKDF